MYLLNPQVEPAQNLIRVKFTFHYVSIKSSASQTSESVIFIFTFHYVSIKSLQPNVIGTPVGVYLHSTMYLLNLDEGVVTHYIRSIYIPLCIY